MHDVERALRLCASKLRRIVAECDADEQRDHAPLLAVIMLACDLLVVGRLTGLHQVLVDINRRLFGTSAHPETRQKNRRLREVLRGVVKSVESDAADPQVKDLIFLLRTIIKILGVHPERSARLPDGRRVPLAVFCQEQIAVIQPLLAPADGQVLAA